MSLNNAFVPKSTLRPHVQKECQAIAAKHRGLLTNGLRQTVQDSLDLDAATSAQYPRAHRWDYVLGLRGNKLVGVEPHSARDDEVSTVIAKKQQASQVLRAHLQPGWHVSAWIWVSSGRVRFSKMDPAIRRLDQNGIRFEAAIIRTF